jgi:hypothetical protein
MLEAKKWIEDSGEVLAFARVLHGAHYFTVDVDPCEAMLSYFEKPWKWTAEREKYTAWRAQNPETELPEDFFADEEDSDG